MLLNSEIRRNLTAHLLVSILRIARLPYLVGKGESYHDSFPRVTPRLKIDWDTYIETAVSPLTDLRDLTLGGREANMVGHEGFNILAMLMEVYKEFQPLGRISELL